MHRNSEALWFDCLAVPFAVTYSVTLYRSVVLEPQRASSRVLYAFGRTVVSQLPLNLPEASPEHSGLVYHRQYLSKDAQMALCAQVCDIIAAAPLFQPVMPRTGKPFSVAMTNCGTLGWVSDKAGYRYQPLHPVTGQPWPTFPPALLSLWRAVAGYHGEPEACLINIYGANARMGSHQDRDEADFAAPVVSVSLGDAATFHVGGFKRGDPKSRFRLESGDVLVLGGASRLAFHGIDKVHAGTSPVPLGDGLAECCRVNLTLRRVNPLS